MSGVDHHIIIIGYSGIATILEFLHRICLPGSDRDHLRSRMKAKNLVAEMLAERDEAHLIVHIHLIAQCNDLLRQLCFPRRSRMRLELKEQLQRRSALRLGEIFPQRRNVVAVREDTALHRGVVKFLNILVLRPGDHRAVQDHERVVRGEMHVQLDAFHAKFLGTGKAGQCVFKRTRMGVEAPVGHDFGLRRQHRGAKQCQDCRKNIFFHGPNLRKIGGCLNLSG